MTMENDEVMQQFYASIMGSLGGCGSVLMLIFTHHYFTGATHYAIHLSSLLHMIVQWWIFALTLAAVEFINDTKNQTGFDY